MYTDEVKELNKILHILMGKFQSEMKDKKYSHIIELSATEISVLQLLHDYPNIILKDICVQLNIPKSTLTSAINRLVKKGYAERISMNYDKRAFSLHITEAGALVQKEHLEFEYSYLSQILSQFDSKEVKTLLRLLKKSVRGDSNA